MNICRTGAQPLFTLRIRENYKLNIMFYSKEGAIDTNVHGMNLDSILTLMITNLEFNRPRRPFQDKSSHGLVFYQNHNYQLNPAS